MPGGVGGAGVVLGLVAGPAGDANVGAGVAAGEVGGWGGDVGEGVGLLVLWLWWRWWRWVVHGAC